MELKNEHNITLQPHNSNISGIGIVFTDKARVVWNSSDRWAVENYVILQQCFESCYCLWRDLVWLWVTIGMNPLELLSSTADLHKT